MMRASFASLALLSFAGCHARDLHASSPGNLVSLLDHIGDTKGHEAGSRTGVQVFFQPITVGLL